MWLSLPHQFLVFLITGLNLFKKEGNLMPLTVRAAYFIQASEVKFDVSLDPNA
jgi:hypothetical protein